MIQSCQVQIIPYETHQSTSALGQKFVLVIRSAKSSFLQSEVGDSVADKNRLFALLLHWYKLVSQSINILVQKFVGVRKLDFRCQRRALTLQTLLKTFAPIH